MDFNLEIINEEDQNPDPLFSSIITAMNSMKEATADKIYQKIQREEATNYSKPQVDRALASALKYGIFEVKNHRYRVRDDILDDVDTVYWKMQRKREQTPFRTQDGTNDRNLGRKLDPEKDNLRFKKISNPEASECPQCGRIKRPLSDRKDDTKAKRERKEKPMKATKEPAKTRRKRQLKKATKYEEEEEGVDVAREEFKKTEPNRKSKASSPTDEIHYTVGKVPEFETGFRFGDRKFDFGSDGFTRPKEFMPGGGKYDTTDESELDSMSFLSDDEQSFGSYQVKPKPKAQPTKPTCRFDSECDDIVFNRGDTETMDPKKSEETVKTESDSDMSSISNDANRSHVENIFNDGAASVLGNSRFNDKKVFFGANKLTGRAVSDDGDSKKAEWISGFADDPNGSIIQTNNMLTIAPRDSLTFKPPEHTSYIS